MKKIIEHISLLINGEWTTPRRKISNYHEKTVPKMNSWLNFGDSVAVYYTFDGEKPVPPTPQGVVLETVTPTSEQLKELNLKKSCGCGAKKEKSATPKKEKFTKKPDDGCYLCAEKHLATAYALYSKEAGYKGLNRWHYLGELNNAANHLWEINPGFAEKIRMLRHDIQLDIPVKEQRWKELATEFYRIRSIELGNPQKIYVFSNVVHTAEQKIDTAPDDMLVFLNKASNAEHYAAHEKKCVFHRANKPEYGVLRSDMPNFFVFDDIPRDVIHGIKRQYDWGYDIEQGKVKSCTTGYMVALYLEKKYPDAEIILVNFGYSVKKSTYRCPWHNWEFEAEQLSRFQHILT